LLNGAVMFKPRGPASTGWDAPGPANNIVTAQVAARGPGGSTSIGGGIDRGKFHLNALGSDANDATIVVFTDGEQNTPPMIAGDPNPSDPLKVNGVRLMDYSTPILTIGLGASAGPFADLLDRIAHETAGLSRITTGALTLDTMFADQLVGALKGNTLSLVA